MSTTQRVHYKGEIWDARISPQPGRATEVCVCRMDGSRRSCEGEFTVQRDETTRCFLVRLPSGAEFVRSTRRDGVNDGAVAIIAAAKARAEEQAPRALLIATKFVPAYNVRASLVQELAYDMGNRGLYATVVAPELAEEMAARFASTPRERPESFQGAAEAKVFTNIYEAMAWLNEGTSTRWTDIHSISPMTPADVKHSLLGAALFALHVDTASVEALKRERMKEIRAAAVKLESLIVNYVGPDAVGIKAVEDFSRGSLDLLVHANEVSK